MRKLRISYIRTQFWFGSKAGGSVGHTLGVLNGFKNNGFKVMVLSNERFLGVEDFEFEIIRPIKIKPGWLGELLYNFYAGPGLKKEILKFKPDFIYHRYTGYTFLVSRIAHRMNIPLVLEFNSFDTWKLRHWESSKNFLKRIVQKVFLYRIVQKIENFNLSKSCLITTVSGPLRRDLLGIGIPEEKILVNYNGVDVNKFNPKVAESKRCQEIKRKLRIGQDKVVVGFSGTFGPWHGVVQLTEAIDSILRNGLYTNIHFIIIGDGGKLKADMVKRLSGYNEVTFTGIIPYNRIQYYLAVCDILVSPHCLQSDGREFFGSPTKIFEYMAMGKGIVASNLGQIGKILKDNETAILVEPENVGELVNGILRLVSSKDLRLKLGKKANDVVSKKYTWDKNISRLMEKIKTTHLLN